MNQVKSSQLPVSHPSGRYTITIGSNLLADLRSIAQIEGGFVVVTDENVAPLYAEKIAGATAVIQIPAGEIYKTLDTVRYLYDELLSVNMDRNGTLVALGGGVVGDITGFVAASYMRGIDFVQCPTTVLAMVDASVGGKTGVDLPQGKNLVGAFKQPTAVIADVSTLRSLPATEFSSGMAEVIKHGLIGDSSLFCSIEEAGWSNDLEGIEQEKRLVQLVEQAIRVKINVVEEDPFEKGKRATLNLGHTFGHAIEQVTGYKVKHGEGVGMGLVAAANLSARLEYCDRQLQQRIEQALHQVGLPTRIPAELSAKTLYEAMGSDKKAAMGRVRFILLRDIEDVFLDGDVAETAVLQSIEAVQK